MDRQALKEAVQLLIESSEYHVLRKEIVEMIAQWPRRQLMFGGDYIALNSLIDLGLQSRESLDNLFQLVERKRKLVPNSKKVDYQRDYMRQRRQRQLKAVKLEEIVRGKPMTTQEKNAYMAAVWAEWMTRRNDYLKGFPDADWKRRNELTGQFWESIDKALEKELDEATKVLGYPDGRKKRVVKVEKPEPNTVMAVAIKKAKEKKK